MLKLKRFFLAPILSIFMISGTLQADFSDADAAAVTTFAILSMISSGAGAWTSYESKDELAANAGEHPRPNMEGSTALSGLSAAASLVVSIVACKSYPALVPLAGISMLTSGMAFAQTSATFGADKNRGDHPYSNWSFGLTLGSFATNLAIFLGASISQSAHLFAPGASNGAGVSVCCN